MKKRLLTLTALANVCMSQAFANNPVDKVTDQVKEQVNEKTALVTQSVDMVKRQIQKGAESLATALKRAEEGDYVRFSGSYSPWLVNWKQTSLGANRFGSNAINVNYQIESTVAHNLSASLDVLGFVFDFEMVETPEDTANNNNTMEQLSLGISSTKLIGDTYVQYRHSSASFKGSLAGVDLSDVAVDDSFSSGTFETDVVSNEVALMTQYGFGFGYRALSYDLPQDVYLVFKNDPRVPYLKVFTNMEYSADFYQFVYEKDNILNREPGEFNIGASIRYGLGTMTPYSEAYNPIQDDLRQLGTSTKIIGDADATLLELNIFASMNLFSSKTAFADIKVGYRTETLEASFAGGEVFSIVSDFETEFSGPYATINVAF